MAISLKSCAKKIVENSGAFFACPKATTFTTQFTTNSPANYHIEHIVFPKTPLKNAHK
jgi:hypothetical protein